MEEQEAVRRLKRGDIGGLEVLVRTYQGQAIRTAYLITHDRALAEDIVQAAFLRAHERIHQFDAGRPFGPWFLRSVVNDAVKAAQRARRHLSLEDALPAEMPLAEMLADPQPSPAALVEAAETKAELWATLKQLPPEQRAAVVLRYYLQMGEAEMAEALDVPPGTVKWRLHTARKRLRSLLRGLWSADANAD